MRFKIEILQKQEVQMVYSDRLGEPVLFIRQYKFKEPMDHTTGYRLQDCILCVSEGMLHMRQVTFFKFHICSILHCSISHFRKKSYICGISHEGTNCKSTQFCQKFGKPHRKESHFTDVKFAASHIVACLIYKSLSQHKSGKNVAIHIAVSHICSNSYFNISHSHSFRN